MQNIVTIRAKHIHAKPLILNKYFYQYKYFLQLIYTIITPFKLFTYL